MALTNLYSSTNVNDMISRVSQHMQTLSLVPIHVDGKPSWKCSNLHIVDKDLQKYIFREINHERLPIDNINVFIHRFHSDNNYYLRHRWDLEMYIGGIGIWVCTLGIGLVVKILFDTVDWVRHIMVDEIMEEGWVSILPLTQTQQYVNQTKTRPDLVDLVKRSCV